MTSNDWLKQAERQLHSAGIGTARLDALVLLEDVTGIDRAKLLAEPDATLPPAQQAALKKLLNRRQQHEPLAYIRGHTEFYGRTFLITPAVLEPRPESETMIDQLKQLVLGDSDGQKTTLLELYNAEKLRIADVGSGSGALGITAKLELPKAHIDLLEIDRQALKVTKTNVDKFTLNSTVLASDLLSDGQPPYQVLLCNLPYVPDNFQLNSAAEREPALAIFGGPDGLDIYRQLFHQVSQLSERPLFILTEALPPQHTALQAVAERDGYRLQQTDDFIQVFALAVNSHA